MAKSLGSAGTVEIKATVIAPADAVGTLIGEVMSAELPQSVNAVDCTTNDSAGNKEYLVGDFDSTFTIEYAYSPSDAGQVLFMNAFDNKTTMYYRYRPTVGSTLPQYIFQGIITDAPVPAEHESLITISATVQVTGGVTRSAQS